MSFLRDDQVMDTAGAIIRYLEDRPNAAETVDGVANWWLLRQRYDDSKKVVQRALDYLVDQGEVQKLVTNRGQVVYKRYFPVPHQVHSQTVQKH